ncbi:hypothetical protein ABGB12_34060 [Actinocorallia sp. B10E7]|uniref:hypothetical protein n=1 Tax=Actinocorallia sp. B10E7 TaxID=3153558 RepID=UPI00325EE891
MLVAFIDEHRDRFGGVEPVCHVLTMHDCSIAPSTETPVRMDEVVAARYDS